MQHLGMDFGAADFKACPETGRLLFLEINSSPMFVRFDQAADYMLTDAIINYLYN
jgi:glutathione synthase/RimK-type ligase-like ATP-grasp enzyme